MLKLLIETISDEKIRENFLRIAQEFVHNPALFGNVAFRTYTFTQAETAKAIPHGLSFQPSDVILTSITGPGALTINYGSIDATHLNFTTTGACVIRLLVGRFGT